MSRSFEYPTKKQKDMFQALLLGNIDGLTRKEASDKIAEGIKKAKEYKSRQHPGYGRRKSNYYPHPYDDDYELGNFGDWGSH